MDGFELNKIAGAVLGTTLGVMALSMLAGVIYAPAAAEPPGYVIAILKPGVQTGGEEASGPKVEPIAARLQVADVGVGASTAKKCLVCHTMEQGGPAKVGPNLYGIVGGPLAHATDFKYSQALVAERDKGLTWTFERLDRFLTDPKEAIPGTAMTFPGLKKPNERADVIAYLRTLSDSPVPLPAVTAAADPAPAKDEPTSPAKPAPAAAEPAPAASEPAPANDEPASPAEPAPAPAPATEQ